MIGRTVNIKQPITEQPHDLCPPGQRGAGGGAAQRQGRAQGRGQATHAGQAGHPDAR